MRSANRIGLALVAALAAAACGDYSTEDIRFLAALPTRADLRVEVPASAASGALAACPSGEAAIWLSAKPTSDGLNAAVDFLVGLVDAVRRVPPSERLDDARRWGPFDDRNHPGREIQVTISRTGDEEVISHAYRFEGRVKGNAAWTAILTGSFEGPSAEIGRGSLELSFDHLWDLGMNDATTPHGTMIAGYDRTVEPRTVQLSLSGFGLQPFQYDFDGYADGSGRFEYRIPKALDTLTIASSFDGAGAGRARVAYQTWLGFGGEFRQCWDASACLVYVDDPNDYSCDSPPCSFGEIGACPAVPSPPF